MNKSFFRPIGIFDSGVGGLQLARHLSRELPEESIYYLADNLRMPYGEKDKEELISLACTYCSFLERFGCKMVVIACNTVSSVALEAVEKKLSIPVIGIVEPCSKEAMLSSKNKRVGLIATPNTIDSKSYETYMDSVTLITSSAPEIAPLIESGKPVEEKVSHYLDPLKKTDIDTLILGCTHYPYIQNLIQQQMGPEVRLIDSATTCIAEIKSRLEKEKIRAPKECVGTVQFFATKPTPQFNHFIRRLFGPKAKKVVIVSS